MTTPHSPLTWAQGTQTSVRSSSPSANASRQWRHEWIAPSWVSIAPFGRPVVPDV